MESKSREQTDIARPCTREAVILVSNVPDYNQAMSLQPPKISNTATACHCSLFYRRLYFSSLIDSDEEWVVIHLWQLLRFKLRGFRGVELGRYHMA